MIDDLVTQGSTKALLFFEFNMHHIINFLAKWFVSSTKSKKACTRKRKKNAQFKKESYHLFFLKTCFQAENCSEYPTKI